MNSNFAEEESYVIVGRDGRLARALLKNAAKDLNKELIFNISARNLEIDLISTRLIPSQTLNVIWSSPVNPNSHYADMKLRSEEFLLSKPSNKITPLVLRLANLYGSNLATTKTSLIDECINNFPNGTLFSIFVNLASQKQYGTFQDYAMSILEATKLMNAGMNQNRVLNLFPPHLYTVKEILEITSEFFEVDWSKLLGHSLNDLPLETTILMNADGITQPSIIWESLCSYLERIGLQDAESKIK